VQLCVIFIASRPDRPLRPGASLAMLSQRGRTQFVNDAIIDVAQPGDLIFIISLGGDIGPLQTVWRRWVGLGQAGPSMWHTAIYSGHKKERNGASQRPYMIHSAEHGFRHTGTIEEHISPGYYTSSARSITILEVARMHLDASQRARIVEYARTKIGTPHDPRGWTRDAGTYLFGLPVWNKPGVISCHALAYEAYGAAHVTFSHQVRTMPWFNAARWRGRPIGQSAGSVSLTSMYLRDHHLYNDDRLEIALRVHRQANEITIVPSPGKYSWLNPTRQNGDAHAAPARVPLLSDPVATSGSRRRFRVTTPD
jgi:hypothetical protein